MASMRRVRVAFVGIFALLVILLFYTSSLRKSQQPDTRTIQDIYRSTLDRVDRARGGGSSGTAQHLHKEAANDDGSSTSSNGNDNGDDAQLAKTMQSRLKEAEQKAKEAANAKAPNKPDSPDKVVGVGSSAGGQKKKGGVGSAGAAAAAAAAAGGGEVEVQESEEDQKIEVMLNDILKKSPVIIFSKSYCPFSKKAKTLLLNKYAIDPAPFIVELDEHPQGREIQAKLGKMTGQTTVPNVMINGKSIGGSDDVAALDAKHELISQIKSLGGKRVSMSLRDRDI